jgi:hypothetical protein
MKKNKKLGHQGYLKTKDNKQAPEFEVGDLNLFSFGYIRG